MKTLLLAVVVLGLVGSVLSSGLLPVAVYCPQAVPPVDVSSTTTFLGICFKERHVGGCDVYTYEWPLTRA